MKIRYIRENYFDDSEDLSSEEIVLKDAVDVYMKKLIKEDLPKILMDVCMHFYDSPSEACLYFSIPYQRILYSYRNTDNDNDEYTYDIYSNAEDIYANKYRSHVTTLKTFELSLDPELMQSHSNDIIYDNSSSLEATMHMPTDGNFTLNLNWVSEKEVNVGENPQKVYAIRVSESNGRSHELIKLSEIERDCSVLASIKNYLIKVIKSDGVTVNDLTLSLSVNGVLLMNYEVENDCWKYIYNATGLRKSYIINAYKNFKMADHDFIPGWSRTRPCLKIEHDFTPSVHFSTDYFKNS